MTQDAKPARISRSDLLELLASVSERNTKDLAAEISRLKAHIASLEAELKGYRSLQTPVAAALETRAKQLLDDNVVLGESVADALKRLQQREAIWRRRRPRSRI